MRSIVFALIGLLLIAPSILAQSDRGTITGTVTDPAGAMIPNVPVEAKNTETGAVYRRSVRQPATTPSLSCRSASTSFRPQ